MVTIAMALVNLAIKFGLAMLCTWGAECILGCGDAWQFTHGLAAFVFSLIFCEPIFKLKWERGR